MPDIPTVATERLTLRPHRLEDFEACASMWADPAVTRFIGGKPHTREEAWSRLLRYIGHWSLLGFGFWAIEEQSTGEYIGEVGFADFHREIDPPITEPEMGWVLSPRAHGKGYATEAVMAALRQQPSFEPVCLIHPDNLASIRVAGKCGFAERCRTTYKGEPTILFGRSNSGLPLTTPPRHGAVGLPEEDARRHL